MLRWVLHRSGLDAWCESVTRHDGGFDLLVSLRDLTIERHVCRSSPGSEEQGAQWRQLYEAYGFSERRRG